MAADSLSVPYLACRAPPFRLTESSSHSPTSIVVSGPHLTAFGSYSSGLHAVGAALIVEIETEYGATFGCFPRAVPFGTAVFRLEEDRAIFLRTPQLLSLIHI